MLIILYVNSVHQHRNCSFLIRAQTLILIERISVYIFKFRIEIFRNTKKLSLKLQFFEVFIARLMYVGANATALLLFIFRFVLLFAFWRR